jgi:hypothetical protein
VYFCYTHASHGINLNVCWNTHLHPWLTIIDGALSTCNVRSFINYYMPSLVFRMTSWPLLTHEYLYDMTLHSKPCTYAFFETYVCDYAHCIATRLNYIMYSILSLFIHTRELPSDINFTHMPKSPNCFVYLKSHTRLTQPTFHYVIALSTQLVRFLRGTSLSEVVFASKSSLSYTAIHWDLSDTLWILFHSFGRVKSHNNTQYIPTLSNQHTRPSTVACVTLTEHLMHNTCMNNRTCY